MKGLRLVGFVLLLASLAGCGGSGSATLYSRNATASCLRAKGLDTSTSSDDLDYIAMNASGGAIHGKIGATGVTISFGSTEAEAEKTRSHYQSVVDVFGTPSGGILTRKGNAVLMWDDTPTAAESSTAEACLTP